MQPIQPGFRARVRAGDEEAFGVLFREHGRSVYNHCFRLTGDWSVAEDCTSLVYLEAWRLRQKVDPEGGSLLPWLFGIAVHVVHRRRRVARRHRELMARMTPPGLLPDFADDVAKRLDDQERIAAVRAALGRLPRADREVLALCVWGGLGYADAAEALAIPVGTVRSRLSRARKRLERLSAEQIPERDRELATAERQVSGDRPDAVRPNGGNAA
ncbi:RNA polymerase sigma factor [Streptomyces sp. NBC_01803]|uniref:RNA polymerase sigma factor n=1 Tax=Streptomyces sp. NBC_01803 TaxID=2975946 RepID=UPI002DDBD63D|nr:RNA polymerase sigma factor [Streptomyces sp. NBC_01803]WSA46470.1 RNA polymerase sigma factor [Streptomyces sp. NBC_01803]